MPVPSQHGSSSPGPGQVPLSWAEKGQRPPEKLGEREPGRREGRGKLGRAGDTGQRQERAAESRGGLANILHQSKVLHKTLVMCSPCAGFPPADDDIFKNPDIPNTCFCAGSAPSGEGIKVSSPLSQVVAVTTPQKSLLPHSPTKTSTGLMWDEKSFKPL